MNTQYVPFRQITEEKVPGKDLKNGVGRHEQMKRGRGMKDRFERSRRIESLIVDVFNMIKPTVPSRVAKYVSRGVSTEFLLLSGKA